MDNQDLSPSDKTFVFTNVNIASVTISRSLFRCLRRHFRGVWGNYFALIFLEEQVKAYSSTEGQELVDLAIKVVDTAKSQGYHILWIKEEA